MTAFKSDLLRLLDARGYIHQATDAEALEAFHYLCRTEGIIPALESSHAIAYAMKLARTFDASGLVATQHFARSKDGTRAGPGTGHLCFSSC